MPADATAGRVVGGRYALTDVLGRGGMGTVWLATDQLLERQVALKEVTFSVDLSDEDRRVLRERTMREARAAARRGPPRPRRARPPPVRRRFPPEPGLRESRGWSWSASRRAACRRSSRSGAR